MELEPTTPDSTTPEEENAPEVTANEVETPAVEEVKKSDTKWYSLRVISGKEKKIKERIDLEISRSNWSDLVKQVVVPTEKAYKILYKSQNKCCNDGM